MVNATIALNAIEWKGDERAKRPPLGCDIDVLPVVFDRYSAGFRPCNPPMRVSELALRLVCTRENQFLLQKQVQKEMAAVCDLVHKWRLAFEAPCRAVSACITAPAI